MNIELTQKTNLIRIIIGAVFFSAGIIANFINLNIFLPETFFVTAYIILGYDIILRAIKNITKGQAFNEYFLMSIATIGALVLGEIAEAAGVMLFYQTGEYFQEMAVEKSKKSIIDLMDIRPDFANLKKNDEIIKVNPQTVCIGETIIVKPGERIPLDGIVLTGNSILDTSALTGESVPRKVFESSEVLSGCVNISGVLLIEVTKTFGESTVSKIINLVENSAVKKAKTEKFITKFARYYTPIVVVLAVLLSVIPPLFFGAEWRMWIHRALVFLVISCPCALVLSIPMGFFAGIGRAAKNGILVKGGNYLEAFTQLDTVVFDKTGTLTRGVFKVTKVHSAAGCSEKELFELAFYAERYSNHPIALSVMEECRLKYDGFFNKDSNPQISNYTEITGCGVSVTLNGKTILAGNEKLMIQNKIDFKEITEIGTKVYVAYDSEYMGCIVISDEIKPDSFSVINTLKERGVQKTVMLTGDNPDIAKAVADELGLDEFYGSLLPHEKVDMVEKLVGQKNTDEKRKHGKLTFVGDGINDAPSLVMADIGIAMGGLGSDAAIEAADIVLMTRRFLQWRILVLQWALLVRMPLLKRRMLYL